MNLENIPTKFYNVGLSYKKADVKVRSTFSITIENQKLLEIKVVLQLEVLAAENQVQ